MRDKELQSISELQQYCTAFGNMLLVNNNLKYIG